MRVCLFAILTTHDAGKLQVMLTTIAFRIKFYLGQHIKIVVVLLVLSTLWFLMWHTTVSRHL